MVNQQAARTVVQTTHAQQSSSILDQIEMGPVRIREVAETAAASGLLKDMTAPRAEMIMLIAQARGIHPIDALMQFDVIDTGSGGLRLAMKAEAMLAYLQRDGWMTELLTGIDDDTQQTYRMSHPTLHPQPKDYTLTMASLDARGVSMRLDKSKSTWDQQNRCYSKVVMCKKETYAMHGASMLRARLISAVTRALRPGILNGVYTPEEVRDFDGVFVSEPAISTQSDTTSAGSVAHAVTVATPAATAPAQPETATNTASVSTIEPTLYERVMKAQLTAKTIKGFITDAMTPAGTADADALEALMERCIAVISPAPEKLPGMSAIWSPFADSIRELCPELDSKLAALGCPAKAPESPATEEDTPFGDVQEKMARTPDDAISAMGMEIASTPDADKITTYNRIRIELVKEFGMDGMTTAQKNRMAALKPK